MNGAEIKELKDTLLNLAKIQKLKKVDFVVWQGQYGTRFLSTTLGFVLDTQENRSSHNIKIIDIG